jgi:methionyl-tRNA formyltransferase
VKFFETGLSKLVILGLNDLACEAIMSCQEMGIETSVISAPRFQGLPSEFPERLGQATCDGWVKQADVAFEEVDSLKASSIRNWASPDSAAFSFDSPFIIKADTLDLFGGAVFNEHGAHLPSGKGGGGYSWRIMENDREGNVLFHLVTVDIDAGPVIYQKPFVFPDSCRKPLDYYKAQHAMNVPALRHLLEQLAENHDFAPEVQNPRFGSYLPRLNTALQAYIDWDWSVEHIANFILAFSDPYEGAKTFLGGAKVYLKDCYVDRRVAHTHPFKFGLIFNITPEGLRVACKDGTLVVTDFQLEGDAEPAVGDRLFTPSELIEDALGKRVLYTPAGMKVKSD